MKFFLFASLSATLLSVSATHAEVLAAWNVQGINMTNMGGGGSGLDANASTHPFSLSAEYTGPNVDTGLMTLGSNEEGSNVNGLDTNNVYGFSIPTGADTTSLEAAIEAHHYLQFTISALTGFTLNLTDVDFKNRLETTGDGADDYALMWSVVGFNAGDEIATASGARTTPPFTAPIDLSGHVAQTAVEFRLYAWNSTGVGTTQITHVGSGVDLTINGTVSSAIPEVQSALPLASLLGFAIIGLRRRKPR